MSRHVEMDREARGHNYLRAMNGVSDMLTMWPRQVPFDTDAMAALLHVLQHEARAVIVMPPHRRVALDTLAENDPE